MIPKRWFALTVTTCGLLLATRALPAGTVDLDTRRVITGLTKPVWCTAPPGDTERLFIVEQRGVIKIYDIVTQTMNPTPFLNIDPIVTGGGPGYTEQGLLGLAFHPDYDTNGYFFVYYTAAGGAGRIARYTVSTTDPDLADATSAEIILTVSQPQSNHNGGHIEFSPVDGYLYMGFGDGGGADDSGFGHAVGGNGQSGTTLLGKMIRLDIDGTLPYEVPADNPFVGDPSHLDEIWAKGLRNPYRFCFDELTGDMWIGDVGQFAREEIDFEPAVTGGRNYGWRCMEGINCYLSGCTCMGPDLTLPVHDYTHGLGCSVTGGRVYRGCAMPEMHGIYFFGDWCNGKIWSGTINVAGDDLLDFTDRTSELAPPPGQGAIGAISAFGHDGMGELYILDHAGGEVFKIVPANIDELDCNGNYIVDTCETGFTPVDCNGNGVDDSCEILSGAATDCNGNGVPDDCDVTSGVLADCDGSGVADLCEVESGAALDCNGNGIPDSCDIAAGLLTDANGDGQPDECDLHILWAQDANGGVGASSAPAFVVATSPDDFGGFSFGLDFDESVITIADVDLTGTVAEGADFFAPNFDNSPGQGWYTVGCVVDIVPPIDTSIAAGVDLPVVRALFAVSGSAAVGDTSPLTLQSGLGDPAVSTVITVGGGVSESPILVSGTFTVAAGTQFRRSDANGDGTIDISDPVYALSYMFSGGPDLPCEDAGDANDDGTLDISDPVYSLGTQFTGGPPPPQPYPDCGLDPTADALDCLLSNCP